MYPGVGTFVLIRPAQTFYERIKVGFMKTEYNLAVETLLASKEALSGTETKLIGSLFADNSLYDGLDPHLMN